MVKRIAINPTSLTIHFYVEMIFKELIAILWEFACELGICTTNIYDCWRFRIIPPRNENNVRRFTKNSWRSDAGNTKKIYLQQIHGLGFGGRSNFRYSKLNSNHYYGYYFY